MTHKTLQTGKDGTAPWRAGVPAHFRDKIAAKQPFEAAPLMEYLLTCNRLMRETVISPHISQHGPLQHMNASHESDFRGYDAKVQECTDARHVTLSPELFLRYFLIHRRTAGSVVGNGRGFRDVRPNGHIITCTHRACGLTAAAHGFEKAPKPADGRIQLDHNLYTLIAHTPYHVRCLENHSKRDRENAVEQAHEIRRRLLTLHGRTDIKIHPAYFSWETGYHWLDEESPALGDLHPSKISGILEEIGQSSQLMTSYARAEGRDFNKQYAALTMLYDPYRLGRINDPRAVFGSLGNEMFPVTAHFLHIMASKASDERLSRLSLASLFYAGFDPVEGHHGHVGGVGGKDGTHILGIMDTSREVIGRVKNHLLNTFPIIHQLTHGGERILSMLYNRDTAEVKFV